MNAHRKVDSITSETHTNINSFNTGNTLIAELNISICNRLWCANNEPFLQDFLDFF